MLVIDYGHGGLCVLHDVTRHLLFKLKVVQNTGLSLQFKHVL